LPSGFARFRRRDAGINRARRHNRQVAAVGVIGCGTAGAAVAILLARAGHDVTVLERVATPGPVGAGIIVQPTGQAVLARLGVLARIAARGTTLDRLWLRTPTGRTLVDLRYAAVDPAWFGIGIHRGALFEALYDAACTEPRIAIATGVDVRGLRHDDRATHVIDATGAAHGPFELVVVADGSVSELRRAAGATTRDVAYPWGALWFVAEDRDRVFDRELYQVAGAPRGGRGRARRLYGVLPTGLGPRGDVPIVSLFWSLAARELEAWRDAGLDAWKAEVRALDPRVDVVLDAITSPDQLTFARYRDVAMSRWHDRNIVFVGDAAHATSPQLGQGANLALVDAVVLADTLAASPGSIAIALEAYSRARRRHVHHYQRMTRLLTPLFQSDSTALGWLRDLTFPIANAVRPLRHHMVRTMAGVARGLGRRALPLP
jgi:2-polyprenyl-6-methoxyphenol hydroxylase-like FAD-dependent oxidoreductase